ncbi:MAG: aminotransferase class V-fold PLP-dependent enzyme [Phycisphaerales bacterium JB060]
MPDSNDQRPDLDRLYLDNAATSFPKAPGVYEAMARYGTEIGASPGRGGYHEARQGAGVLGECRRLIARLVNTPDPDRVIFTLNTSDALNMAIKGLVFHRLRTDPDARIHVVTTAMDHNSVLRPLNALRAMLPGLFRWTRVPVDAEGIADPGDIAAAMTDQTVLVAVVHASNATGAIQPIGQIGAACRRRGVPFLVDAAQSVGHLPVDVRANAIDLLAFPGHKGLLGPLGTGGLCIAPGMEEQLDTLREGGTGSRSEWDTQPTELPDKYEPGSHNTVGIAGLDVGVRYVLDRGIDQIRQHEVSLSERFVAGLDEIPGVRLVGPRDPQQRVAVFSLVFDGIDPSEAAGVLERDHGLLVRAGLHCAPGAHESMDTTKLGGTVRVSFGPFTTPAEVERTLAGIAQIAPVTA